MIHKVHLNYLKTVLDNTQETIQLHMYLARLHLTTKEKLHQTDLPTQVLPGKSDSVSADSYEAIKLRRNNYPVATTVARSESKPSGISASNRNQYHTKRVYLDDYDGIPIGAPEQRRIVVLGQKR